MSKHLPFYSLFILPLLLFTHDLIIYRKFKVQVEKQYQIVVDNINDEKPLSDNLDSDFQLINKTTNSSNIEIQTYSFKLKFKRKYLLKDSYPSKDFTYKLA